MIEELKVLLPLLNDATSAAVWLIAAKMLSEFLFWTMLLAVAAAAFFSGLKAWVKVHAPEPDVSPLEGAYYAVRHAWLREADSRGANSAGSELFALTKRLEKLSAAAKKGKQS